MITSFLASIERGCAWFGRVASWTLPLLVVSVCVSVVLVQLRANELLHWGTSLPVFGQRLTLNGLNDLQWHLFAIVVMLGTVYALYDNAHVSVDFLASGFTPSTRKLITIVCDLVILLPFACVMAWFSWQYVLNAYTSGEGSSYGGLGDRWIIKAVMPLGFGLLGLFGLARALRLSIELATGRSTPGPTTVSP